MRGDFYKTGWIGRQDPYLYVIGMVIILFAYMLGQGPMLLVLQQKMATNPEIGLEELMKFEQTTDFSIMDIHPNTGFILLITIFLLATLGLYITLKYLHQKPFKSIVTAFDKVDWSRILFGWVAWIILGVLAELFFYLIDPSNYTFEVKWSDWFVLVVIALVYLPVQSSLEEFVFRGYLLQAFGRLKVTRIVPVLITGLLFALPHFFNPEIAKFGLLPMCLYYISAGIILGIIVVMDDRLELALGVHAATNFFGAALVNFEGSVLTTDALFTVGSVNAYYMWFTFVISGSLFLLASKRYYQWEPWSKLVSPCPQPSANSLENQIV